MPPLKGPVVLDVHCLIPYRSNKTMAVAPPAEKADRNRELVFAFKNGRAVDPEYGGLPFIGLVARIVRACAGSPLGPSAALTAWVPVPRSGASKPSKDPQGDPYPCWTLARVLAEQLGGTASDVFTRRFPLREKHRVQPNIASLQVVREAPSSPSVVLLDDVKASGSSLVACAVHLRKAGYQGTIAAFCVGNDVAPEAATEVHDVKTSWEVRWPAGRPLPTSTFKGTWDRRGDGEGW